MHHWICLVKTLRLSTHMTIFWIIIFLIKKVAKLVETQKFHHHRLDHSFLHQGSYSHFLIWWIFRKLAFYHLFWGISNEKIYVTPHGRNWKKLLVSCSTTYQKMLHKDVFSFPNNSKKPSKLGCFWGGRNGMKQMYKFKKIVTVSELWISNFF